MATFKNPFKPEKNVYVDNKLDRNLSKQVAAVTEKDKDKFFVVDGKEGSGKSVFAMQLAARVDPSFNLSKVCFTPSQFKQAIYDADKGQAVVFDEAFTGLSSRAALSKINTLLVSLMMEMRQKNLFVFIVMPSIFILDKYVALHRAVGLFHVFTKKGKRGYWIFFNRHKKKMLYLFGKQTYSYSGKSIPKSGFKGKFLDQYVVDENLYRLKKKKALKDKTEVKESFEGQLVRDRLLWCLSEEFKLSGKAVSELIKKYGVEFSPRAVLYAVKHAKEGGE